MRSLISTTKSAWVDDVLLDFFDLGRSLGFDRVEVADQAVLGTCFEEQRVTARGIGYRRLEHVAARFGHAFLGVCKYYIEVEVPGCLLQALLGGL